MTDELVITCRIEKQTKNCSVYKDGSRDGGVIIYMPRGGQRPAAEITVSVSLVPAFEIT